MAALNPLKRWQRRLLDGTGLVLLSSGAAWLVLHYAIAGDGLPLPAEAWFIKLHGAAGFVALFVAGVLAAVHIPAGARMRSRRPASWPTGLALCACLGATVLSAYLLYYWAPEWLRPGLGWFHAGAGALMAAALPWHRPRRAA